MVLIYVFWWCISSFSSNVLNSFRKHYAIYKNGTGAWIRLVISGMNGYKG